MSKELKYVECPNCGEVFDDSDKFIEKKTFLNHHKFTCQNCDYSFKYPSSRPYWRNFFICFPINLFICSPLLSYLIENPSEGADFFTVPLFLLLLPLTFLTFIFSLEGFLGGVSNYFLKKEIHSNYKERLHNTFVTR